MSRMTMAWLWIFKERGAASENEMWNVGKALLELRSWLLNAVFLGHPLFHQALGASCASFAFLLHVHITLYAYLMHPPIRPLPPRRHLCGLIGFCQGYEKDVNKCESATH